MVRYRRLGPIEETIGLNAGTDVGSAQRELLTRISELSFHGVPALPSKKEVRAELERAWFEQVPLRITYVDGNFIESTRTIRITSVAMDRHETRIDATDADSGERRQFRLDRIQRAQVVTPPVK